MYVITNESSEIKTKNLHIPHICEFKSQETAAGTTFCRFRENVKWVNLLVISSTARRTQIRNRPKKFALKIKICLILVRQQHESYINSLVKEIAKRFRYMIREYLEFRRISFFVIVMMPLALITAHFMLCRERSVVSHIGEL